jgi:GntR family transcriptional repressor for pyruvate dehydrogenase complex
MFPDCSKLTLMDSSSTTQSTPAASNGSRRRGRGSTRTAARRGCVPIVASDAVTGRLKTSEIVAREVVKHIVGLGLQPGDRLPPEAEMVEGYHVSRESIREGLRLLEVQGLISLRRGQHGGPVVGGVDPGYLGRNSTLFYHLAGASYRELFEAWALAETILAERAARHLDAELRAEAMAPYLIASDGRHSPEALDVFVKSHSGFHAAVASLANNRVLELSLQTLGLIVSHHTAVTADPRDLADLIEDDHLRIARAIEDGDCKRARTVMGKHIHGLAGLHTERLGTKTDEYIEWL